MSRSAKFIDEMFRGDPPKGKQGSYQKDWSEMSPEELGKVSDEALFKGGVEDNRKDSSKEKAMPPADVGALETGNTHGVPAGVIERSKAKAERDSSVPPISKMPRRDGVPQVAGGKDIPTKLNADGSPVKDGQEVLKGKVTPTGPIAGVDPNSSYALFADVYNRMRPEWDQEQANRLKNIAKINAIGDALKLGFEGFYGSKGARIDERAPGDLQTLAYFDQMKQKYDTEKAALNSAMYDEATERMNHEQEMEKVVTQEQGQNFRKVYGEDAATDRAILDNDMKKYGIDMRYATNMREIARKEGWDENYLAYLYEALKYKNTKGDDVVMDVSLYKDKPFVSIQDDAGYKYYIPVEVYDSKLNKAMNSDEVREMYKAEKRNMGEKWDPQKGFASKDYEHWVKRNLHKWIDRDTKGKGNYTAEYFRGNMYYVPYQGASDLEGTNVNFGNGASGIEGAAIPNAGGITNTAEDPYGGTTEDGSALEQPRGVTGSLLEGLEED